MRPGTEDAQAELATEVLEGRAGDGELLFFVHGFPDDAAVWRGPAKRLAAERSVRACPLVTMPFCSAAAAAQQRFAPSAQLRRDHGDNIALLAGAIRSFAASYGRRSVTLVLHDWGSLHGFLLFERHPELVRHIVSVDVGFSPALGMGPPSLRAAAQLVRNGMLYQWLLIGVWLLSLLPLPGGLGRRAATFVFTRWARGGKAFVEVALARTRRPSAARASPHPAPLPPRSCPTPAPQ